MNIYKKSKLRNLTNEELEKLLKESNWYDKDLLREYNERYQGGRIKLKQVQCKKWMSIPKFNLSAGMNLQGFYFLNIIPWPPD